MRQVKIDIKDLVKKEEKEHRKKTVENTSREYDYVFNRDTSSIPSIITRFIRERKGESLSEEIVEKYIGKYLSN